MSSGYGSLIYLILLLLIVGSTVLFSWRAPFGQTIRMMLIWGAIFAAGFAFFAFNPDLTESLTSRRIGAPEPAVITTGGELRVPQARDGHFYVRAEVNGAPVNFLVDTGATVVVLSRDAARAAGFQMSDLRYRGFSQTVGGMVKTAPVTLDRVQLGSLSIPNVEAVVLDNDVGINLLGMSFLRRLGGYRVEDGVLIINT